MRNPGIAFLVLLVASSAAVSTRAPAAPLSPAVFAAGAVPSQYLRVQYGGGDDDDGPSYQPQHSHQHSNYGGGGGGGGGAIAGLIVGVASMAIREGLKQKQINDYRQQQQVYQIQNQRQQQARKQNQRQAAQQRRNNEAQVAKQKREEARANEKHQEEVDELNRQKRELAQLKKDIENQKAAQNKPSGYPPGDNNPAGNTDTRTETYENDSKDDVVFNIIPYRSNDPDPGTIRVGPLTLYPNHIDFPADRAICTGTTAKGCFLRIVTTPSAGGGSKQECILYCKQPPQSPKVVVIEPTPTPRYPTPTPTPPPPRYVEPYPTPTPTPPPPRYVEPYPTPTPIVKLIYGVDTDKAEDYEEPKRPAKPAVVTDKAEDYEEPKRRLTPAVVTDKAEDYEEPKRRLTLAVDTDKAEDYEEPKRTLTPAVETEKATASGGGQLDEAEIINPVECPNLNLGACGARFKKQREEEEKKREEEEKIARDEKKKRDDEIARKNKEAAEDKYAIEHPGDLDSKGCTIHGDIPVQTLLTKDNYQQLVDTVLGPPTRPVDGPTRTIVTSGLKVIPDIGSLVSGVVSFFWKDPANDEMFKALVNYVDALVPDSITKERVAQMKDDLDGLRDNLNSYLQETDLYQKGLDLKILNNTLQQMGKKFFNDRTEPEKQLALVVAFGTLRLMALKEQILHQDQYYPGHPSSLAVSDMNEAVKQFAKLASDMKSKIIERRLAKLRVEAGHERERRYDADGASYWADGSPNFTAVDDQCDWSRKHIGPGRGEVGMSLINAYNNLGQRTNDVRKAYNRDLDVLLAPIAHWPSITPVAAPADANGRPNEKSAALSDGANLDEAGPGGYARAQALADPDKGTDLGSYAKEALSNLPLALAKSCTRHFANNSYATYELRGSPGSGVCEAPGSCVAQPHSTIEIHYPVLESSIQLTITGDGGKSYNDTFEVKQGNLIDTGNCAYIKHSGNTGKVTLNDPADGDVVATASEEEERQEQARRAEWQREWKKANDAEKAQVRANEAKFESKRAQFRARHPPIPFSVRSARIIHSITHPGK